MFRKIELTLTVMDPIGPMGHYSNSITRSLLDSSEVNLTLFCLSDSPETTASWRKAFPSLNIQFIEKPASKLKRKIYDFWSGNYDRAIAQHIRQQKTDCLHILAPGAYLNNLASLNTICPTLLTVHDAIEHDKVFDSSIERAKYELVYSRNQKRMKDAQWLVALSNRQEELLKQKFGEKKVLRQAFPSLITDEIIRGRDTPPELRKENGYILFFGRIEEYKGLDLLYSWFREQGMNYPEQKLIIAGKGSIPFRRSIDENNIIWINRFIRDKEIRELITRSSVLVLPYRAATQSGPVTLGKWFRKRMVLSDVEGLSEFAGETSRIHLFRSGDQAAFSQAMAASLQRVSQDLPVEPMSIAAEDHIIANSLVSIYQNALKKDMNPH